jgi:hypothetical protein
MATKDPVLEAAAQAHFGCTLYRMKDAAAVAALWATSTSAVRDHSYNIAGTILAAARAAEAEELI